MTTLNIQRTVLPDEKLDFISWCKALNVSRLYIDRTPIHNAERIMALWNGCTKMKEKFIKLTNPIQS